MLRDRYENDKFCLQRADLSGAKLQLADLTVAKLQGANLQRADLFGAKLQLANLQRADLFGAEVSDEQLAQSESLEGATMPDGTKHE